MAWTGGSLWLRGLLSLPHALQYWLCLTLCWDPFSLWETLWDWSNITLILLWVGQNFPKTLGFSL